MAQSGHLKSMRLSPLFRGKADIQKSGARNPYALTFRFLLASRFIMELLK
jgi:hypothetical protein